MSKIITIVGNEVVVTSTNGSETQVQKIQLKNNYYTQVNGTNVSIVNNEHHVVYIIPAADFSPSSTATQIQTLLTGIINSSTVATVTSATWGFDVLGVLFYVKQMSDGSVVYESPIGTVTAPTGDVNSIRTLPSVSNFVIIENNINGTIAGGNLIKWKIENVGGATGLVNSVNLLAGKSVQDDAFFYQPTGLYYACNAVGYDATGTTFLITYTTV